MITILSVIPGQWFEVQNIHYEEYEDGEFLYKMMLKDKSYGMKVFWQYIIFDWNKWSIDLCKQMAKEGQTETDWPLETDAPRPRIS